MIFCSWNVTCVDVDYEVWVLWGPVPVGHRCLGLLSSLTHFGEVGRLEGVAAGHFPPFGSIRLW